MRFQYHNTLWVFIAGVLIIVWALYDYAEATEDSPEEGETRRGRYVLKHGEVRNYDSFGNLKTLVTYDNGVKHGLSVLYYPDGKPQLEMTYVRGNREGISRKYYKSGRLYAETPYEDDKLTGIRKTYYRNGRLQSEMPYWRSLPGKGLKEYYTNGNVKELNPRITFSSKGGRFWVSTNYACRSKMFYLGFLINDQYLNEKGDMVVPLPQEDGKFYIDKGRDKEPGISVICACKTKSGNPLIFSTKL